MLTAIETQLTAHILSTTIETCAFGLGGNVSHYPSARCAWRGGEVRKVSGAGSLRDVALMLEVLIDATDAPSARDSAEELSELWYDATRFAQLSAHGVVSILPSKLQPPVDHGSTQQLAQALVSFEVVVRMS